MEKTVVRIEGVLKRYVVRWQSLLQVKVGRRISQGDAVALACLFMYYILDSILILLKNRSECAELLKIIADDVTKAAERAANKTLNYDSLSAYLDSLFKPVTKPERGR